MASQGHAVVNADAVAVWQACYRHQLAAISEGLCPACTGVLGVNGTCLSGQHGPVAWHLCRESELAQPGLPAVTVFHFLDSFWPIVRCKTCGWQASPVGRG
jgi:hypothetical protein